MDSEATPKKKAPSDNRRLQKIVAVTILGLLLGLAEWEIYQADMEEATTGRHVPRIGDRVSDKCARQPTT
jgi:hypothetical protein